MTRLTPPDRKISAIVPGPGVTDGMAMVIEAILTFNLVFVGLVVSDPRRRSIIASVATGFSIGSGAMAAVSITSVTALGHQLLPISVVEDHKMNKCQRKAHENRAQFRYVEILGSRQ